MGLSMLSCRPAFKGSSLVSGRPVDLSRIGVGQGLCMAPFIDTELWTLSGTLFCQPVSYLGKRVF